MKSIPLRETWQQAWWLCQPAELLQMQRMMTVVEEKPLRYN
jgi:hypothetical protein